MMTVSRFDISDVVPCMKQKDPRITLSLTNRDCLLQLSRRSSSSVRVTRRFPSVIAGGLWLSTSL